MKINFWSTLSSRKRRIISWVVGLFLFYTVLGFFILPPIVRAIAVKELSKDLDRKASIKWVKINPYAFSVSVQGLLIEDKDGQPFISWDEVYVRFQPSSLFRKEWTFGKIRVIKPYIRAQMNKDYTFNFSDLVKKYSPGTNAAPTKPSKPLLVRVNQLMVTNATISVADFTVRTPFKRVIGPLHLELENFHTEPGKDSPYSFAGITDAGEMFAWHGYVCLDPLRSEGGLSVDHVTLNKFYPLYQDLVRFNIRSGQIGMHANYRFELSSTNRIAAVTNAAFALRDFKLAELGSTNDIVDLYHFSMLRMSADLQSHHFEAGRIFANGAHLVLQRNKAKEINAVEISKPGQNTADKSGAVVFLLRSVTNAVAMLLNSTNEWTAEIHEIDYTNCSMHLRDYANLRPASLDLDNFVLDAKNASNIPKTNFTAVLSMDWNRTGKIKVAMSALVTPPSADIYISLKDLGLSSLDPYLESSLNLLIPAGEFSLDGHIRVTIPPNGLPDARFHGDTWLNNFNTVDGALAQELLKWDSIHVAGIDASLNPLGASIQQISIVNPAATVVIETNRTINLLEALHPAVTNAPAQTNAPVVAKKSAAPSTNSMMAGLPQISISSIVISNAQFNFTDLSLNPNVHMVIDQASGTISGISTAELQHGDVDLHALVDGVGPARITGRINPFSGTQTNELKISLANMDLVPTSPYSGKYAGYRIARGELSLDLSYFLVGRKLKSENNITLDKFTFGEKVDSPDATKLPVRLGIAILKDRDGKIVLNVPIEGSLDDPKFRVGKVVMRAIVNILTKVATSPFSLLSAAFSGGGGEELGYDDFEPGSTGLSDAAKKKLDVVIKALYNRPGLQLEISGSVDPASDRDGLQRAALEKQLRQRQWMSLSKSKRDTITPDQITITPEQRAKLVKKMYDQAERSGQINPYMLQTNESLSAIASQIKSPEAKTTKLSSLLIQKPQAPAQQTPAAAPSSSKLPPISDPKEALLTAIIPVSESDLEHLAIKRAEAVRAYVIQDGKVEASRLTLTQSQTGGLRQDGSRVYLQLD